MTSTFTFVSPATPHRNSADGWIIIDATLLVLTMVVSSDMLIQLGLVQALAWLTCYALTLLRIAMLWPHFAALALRNKVVFAFPLTCLASVLWSFSPLDSLIAAIQLTMTMVIAMFLGWRYSLIVLMKTLVIVLTVAFVLSLLHWALGIFPWPIHNTSGGMAGLFKNKNQLGQRTMVAIVMILTIWVLPRASASRPFKLALVFSMVLAFISLGLSENMTSVLMTPVLIAIWLLLSRHWVSPGIVIPAAGAAVLLVTLGPLLLSLFGINPVTVVLDAVGKSSTLTGRTLLWDIGLDVLSRHPFLGVGYVSFWDAPEFYNESQAMRNIGGEMVGSFHNFILEILVSAGWPALFAMLLLIYVATFRLYQLYTRFGSAPAAGGLVLVVTIVGASLAGPSLFRGHEAMIVLLVVLMVSAQEDDLSRRLQARPQTRQA